MIIRRLHRCTYRTRGLRMHVFLQQSYMRMCIDVDKCNRKVDTQSVAIGREVDFTTT